MNTQEPQSKFELLVQDFINKAGYSEQEARQAASKVKENDISYEYR